MEITVNQNGTDLTLTPIGRLDTTTAPQLQATINENIRDVTGLTFDLSKLVYLSSAGLRVLMNAQKTMKQQGKMRITHVNEDIMDIFEMTGLTDVFRFE
ncbi:STAS domain-containing protein [Ruminococcus sp.]|uniref:STAS domain-containing protein n=1 Tax=Ruminococcus sp. TaxID=41978 RepID=UPI00388EA1CF